MIIDKYGLPKDVGATDKMDSARLAGLMACLNHPLAPDLSAYVINNDQCVRNPHEFPANNPNNFSRDQLMCLVAGLHAQGRADICAAIYEAAIKRNCRAQNIETDYPGTIKKFPDGADILAPSHMMILGIAANKGTTILGTIWLIIDILFNAIFTPTRESNQLVCQLTVAGTKWLKFYKLVTPMWRTAIKNYWSENAGSWRKEPELAQLMIDTLEKI